MKVEIVKALNTEWMSTAESEKITSIVQTVKLSQSERDSENKITESHSYEDTVRDSVYKRQWWEIIEDELINLKLYLV